MCVYFAGGQPKRSKYFEVIEWKTSATVLQIYRFKRKLKHLEVSIYVRPETDSRNGSGQGRMLAGCLTEGSRHGHYGRGNDSVADQTNDMHADRSTTGL